MNILLLSNNRTTIELIAETVEDYGFSLSHFSSAEQVIGAFTGNALHSDIAFIDISDVNLDNPPLPETIKELSDRPHIPVIMICDPPSSKEASRMLLTADDYLFLPLDETNTSLKMNVHSRLAQASHKMEEKNLELRRHQRMVRTEHEIVENIFANHCKRHMLQSELLRYHISPVSLFNGDVLLTAEGPAGNLYIAIGDVTGHGLPAAVSGMPIYPTFRAMAQKGFPVGTIAAEMNKALLNLMPDNMMLAATLLELNSSADRLTVWSGGMPDMIVDNGTGAIKHLIKSQHPPLSACSENEFSIDVAVYELNQGDRIYLYTDGVEESRNRDQEMFGEERLQALFNGDQSDMFNAIVDALEAFTEGNEQDDDITLVELCCQPNASYHPPEDNQPESIQAIPWNLSVAMSHEDIRQNEPIPQIVNLLSNATGLRVHEDFISTILSEFYSNALEHGLLKLDSAIKQDEDGFIEYYQLRRERLEQLEHGTIIIRLDFQPRTDGGFVDLSITDSGDGFDYQQKYGQDEDSYGRGINLIEALCSNLRYSDGGRTVSARYHLNSPE